MSWWELRSVAGGRSKQKVQAKSRLKCRVGVCDVSWMGRWMNEAQLCAWALESIGVACGGCRKGRSSRSWGPHVIWRRSQLSAIADVDVDPGVEQSRSVVGAERERRAYAAEDHPIWAKLWSACPSLLISQLGRPQLSIRATLAHREQRAASSKQACLRRGVEPRSLVLLSLCAALSVVRCGSGSTAHTGRPPTRHDHNHVHSHPAALTTTRNLLIVHCFGAALHLKSWPSSR